MAVDLATGSALLRRHLDAVVNPAGIRHYAAQAVAGLVATLDNHRAKDEQTAAGKIGWLFIDMHNGVIQGGEFLHQAAAIAEDPITFLTSRQAP